MENEISALNLEQRQFNELMHKIKPLQGQFKDIVHVLSLVLNSDSIKLSEANNDEIISSNRFINMFNLSYNSQIPEIQMTTNSDDIDKINHWTKYCDQIFENGYTDLSKSLQIIKKIQTSN